MAYALHVELLDDKTYRIIPLPDCPYRIRHLINRLPESKYRVDGYWDVPLTELNFIYLRDVIKVDCLEFTEEAWTVWDYSVKTILLADMRERRRWKYFFNDDVPTTVFQYHTEPYRHQIVALDALHNQEFFALFMEMGTGKSKVIIDELYACAKANPGYRAFIVAPKTVVRNWIKEFKKHLRPDITLWIERCRTGEKGVQQLLEGHRSKADLKVWLANYERVACLLDGLKIMKFDLLVLDESTKIKHRGAQRTKACLNLGPTAIRRAILTGSPVTNSIFDLWTQFEFLQPGSLGYMSQSAFKQKFAHVRRFQNWEKVTGLHNLDLLKRCVARHSFIVTKDQCLDLPPKTFETLTIDMGPQQRQAYEQMVDWFMAEITTETGEKGFIEARSVLAKLVRLAQITQGFIHSSEGQMMDIADGQGKLKAAMDLVDDLPPDRKLLIWCRFRHDVDLLSQELTTRKMKYLMITGRQGDKERETAVETFNATNDTRVLIGNPSTGGYGIDLLGSPEMPCHTVLYYSNDYSLEKRLQSEDRSHRIGQTHPVTYIDLACVGSIDQHIIQKLQAKRALGEEMRDMESLRSILLGEGPGHKIRVVKSLEVRVE